MPGVVSWGAVCKEEVFVSMSFAAFEVKPDAVTPQRLVLCLDCGDDRQVERLVSASI